MYVTDTPDVYVPVEELRPGMVDVDTCAEITLVRRDDRGTWVETDEGYAGYLQRAGLTVWCWSVW